jgi:hypothetical protein
MRHVIYPLLVLLLSACTSPIRPGIPARATAIPPPAAAATEPAPRAASDAPAYAEALPPNGLLTAPYELAWHGLRLRYDPQQYVFAITPREYLRIAHDRSALDTAHLVQVPDRCSEMPLGADCFPSEVRLAVFANDGLDVPRWLEQVDPGVFWWPGAAQTRSVLLGGREALAWAGDGVRANETTYALAIGAKIVLVAGELSQPLLDGISIADTPPQLTPGQLVATTSDHAWELWTDPVGGERITERPRLYTGAWVSLLALREEAVLVRTVDNVAGWIHAPAAQALTTEVAVGEAPARFLARGETIGQIIHSNSIPLRAAPFSNAPERGPALPPGQQFSIIGVSGDWLEVWVAAPATIGRSGWVRWYYDGARYVDLVES